MRHAYRAPIVNLLARTAVWPALALVMLSMGSAAQANVSGPAVRAARGGGVAATTGTEAVQLERLLRADGSLDLSTGYHGSVSTSGWRVVADASDGPRFIRGDVGFTTTRGTPASQTQLTSVPEDTRWDGRFAYPGMDHPVYTLAVDGSSNLYAGGAFTMAGGVSANHVAKWDGTSWSALGSGVGYFTVRDLAVDGSGNLYAGGDFNTAGGKQSLNFAIWHGAMVPVYLRQLTAERYGSTVTVRCELAEPNANAIEIWRCIPGQARTLLTAR